MSKMISASALAKEIRKDSKKLFQELQDNKSQ